MKNIVTRWVEAKAAVVGAINTLRAAHHEAKEDIKKSCGQSVKDFSIALGTSPSGDSILLDFIAAFSGSVHVRKSGYKAPELTNNDGAHQEWGYPIELAEWLANKLLTIPPRMVREECEKTL